MYHLIENNSKRPDITFSSILCSFQNLRGHINGTTNAGLKHLWSKIINIFSKSKVTYFISSLINENVGWLKITMNDFLSNKFSESTKNLPHYFECFFLFESFFLYDFLQISIFAEFSNDIKTIFGTEDIFEAYDIEMIESFEEIDFRKYGIFKILVICECG